MKDQISVKSVTSHSAIIGLFNPGGPSAILFAVASVVVDALDCCISLSKLSRMSEVARMHVIPEILKRRPDDLNSSPTPVLVIFTLWIVAAVPHIIPSTIKAGVGHAVLCL